jgi:hypothetical protein
MAAFVAVISGIAAAISAALAATVSAAVTPAVAAAIPAGLGIGDIAERQGGYRTNTGANSHGDDGDPQQARRRVDIEERFHHEPLQAVIVLSPVPHENSVSRERA